MKQAPHTRRPLLFLSHGATQENLRAVAEVARALTEKGFEVFEYARSIEAGKEWRFRILTALLLCDSAVVLSDARSGTRKWVRYEVAVCEARREHEPGFVMKTVEFGPTRSTASVIEELSAALPRAGLSAGGPDYRAALTRAVEEYSEALDDVGCKACIDALVVERRVASLLGGVPRGPLGEMLEELEGVPLWEQSDIEWDAVAALDRVGRWAGLPLDVGRAVTRRGLRALPAVIRTAGPHLAGDELRRLFELLAPLMVPLSEVGPLASLFSRESGHRGPYVVNADSTRLVACAIRRAWGVERGPSYDAPILRLEGGFGEHTLEEFTGEFLHALRAEARMSPAEDERELELLAAEGWVPEIETEDQNAALAFVVAPASLLTEEVLEALKYRFGFGRNIVFILVRPNSDSYDLPPSAMYLGDLAAGDLGELLSVTNRRVEMYLDDLR